MFAGGSALAEDLPARAAYYKGPPASYGWTGFYAGGNWGYESANWQARPTFIDPNFIPEYQAYLPGKLTNDVSDNRALGGVQIGYNYQMGRLVLGIEADYDFSHLKASRSTGIIPGPFPVAGHNAQFSEDVGSDNLATVRGRLGATFDNFLIFGTGGLAVTSASFSRSVILLNGAQPFTGPGVSETMTGWVLGGGFEYRLTSA